MKVFRPKSIALQQYSVTLLSMPKKDRLNSIHRRLLDTIVLYENETVGLRKDIWHSDIHNLNRMFKDALIALAHDILEVNAQYSIDGIGRQFAERCRTIHKQTIDIAAARIQLEPYVAAWQVLSSFPREDLTISVE